MAVAGRRRERALTEGGGEGEGESEDEDEGKDKDKTTEFEKAGKVASLAIRSALAVVKGMREALENNTATATTPMVIDLTGDAAAIGRTSPDRDRNAALAALAALEIQVLFLSAILSGVLTYPSSPGTGGGMRNPEFSRECQRRIGEVRGCLTNNKTRLSRTEQLCAHTMCIVLESVVVAPMTGAPLSTYQRQLEGAEKEWAKASVTPPPGPAPWKNFVEAVKAIFADAVSSK